jgi:hypothetical protein
MPGRNLKSDFSSINFIVVFANTGPAKTPTLVFCANELQKNAMAAISSRLNFFIVSIF